MQGKLFQRCTHLLYCSVLSPGSNVNTSRMSQPDMRSIFHIKKSMKYSGHRKLSCALSKLSKFNAFNPLLDTKQTRMHLILLTYSTQRELVSICTQIIHTIEISFPCIIAMNFCHNFQISYYLERAKLNEHFGQNILGAHFIITDLVQFCYYHDQIHKIILSKGIESLQQTNFLTPISLEPD